jgi:hypothetical protein
MAAQMTSFDEQEGKDEGARPPAPSAPLVSPARKISSTFKHKSRVGGGSRGGGGIADMDMAAMAAAAADAAIADTAADAAAATAAATAAAAP